MVAACGGTKPCFLTKKGGQRYTPQTDSATQRYYNTIDPSSTRRTFAAWKTANGFGGPDEVRAIYFNSADLNIGRDMHCVQGNGRAACYVTNYGPAPGSNGFPNSTTALSDAVAAAQATAGGPPFATVAMEWTPFSGQANNVTFFIFDSAGTLINFAALDSEGRKSVPQMCLACHGGRYITDGDSVGAASFLPFILVNLQFSQTPKFTRGDQEEAFRKLNEIVVATRPNPTNAHDPIDSLLIGLYPSGIHTAGSTQRDDYVPPGWTNPSTSDFYLNYVRPYCRTCHLADETIDFTTYQGFRQLGAAVKTDVCAAHVMPQAEVTWNQHWAFGNVQAGALDNVLPPAQFPPKCGP